MIFFILIRLAHTIAGNSLVLPKMYLSELEVAMEMYLLESGGAMEMYLSEPEVAMEYFK